MGGPCPCSWGADGGLRAGGLCGSGVLGLRGCGRRMRGSPGSSWTEGLREGPRDRCRGGAQMEGRQAGWGHGPLAAGMRADAAGLGRTWRSRFSRGVCVFPDLRGGSLPRTPGRGWVCWERPGRLGRSGGRGRGPGFVTWVVTLSQDRLCAGRASEVWFKVSVRSHRCGGHWGALTVGESHFLRWALGRGGRRGLRGLLCAGAGPPFLVRSAGKGLCVLPGMWLLFCNKATVLMFVFL